MFEWEELGWFERILLTVLVAALICLAGSLGFLLILIIAAVKFWIVIVALGCVAVYRLLLPITKWFNRKMLP